MHIKIDEGDALYLRRLLFEIDGYKAIISVLANCDCQNEWHDQKYEEACSMLEQLNAEYNIALDEIKARYIPEDMRDDSHHMTIDYRNYEIVIEECGNCAASK